MSPFIPTADIADIRGTEVISCDLQFRDFGRNHEFAGPMTTIRCFEDNGLVKQILATPGQGRVLVIDALGSLRTAMVGGNIARSAVENGWQAIIVNGAIRDSAEIAELDIAVKALGTNPRKSAKEALGAVDVPVSFGGVRFLPDHFVYGDADGVVVTPESIKG